MEVFESTERVSRAPCGSPYVVAGLGESSKGLMDYTPQFFREKRGIDLHTGARVVEAGDGYIRVEENGKESRYEWDKLVIATGASPRIPPIDGTDLKNVFTADLPPDAAVIKAASKDAKTVVIIGAGYIGVEMSEAFVALNKNVTLIGIYDYPLPRFDEEMGRIIKEKMTEKVNLRMNEHAIATEGKKKVEKVVTDKGEYPADLVIIATGVKPNTELAEQLGSRSGQTSEI